MRIFQEGRILRGHTSPLRRVIGGRRGADHVISVALAASTRKALKG
ncbi:MAG TPA: hypothetical protein VL126_01005 [Bacteroidota bacterium]|nr:hypothetical protein [Bacteroidota bacterium]